LSSRPVTDFLQIGQRIINPPAKPFYDLSFAAFGLVLGVSVAAGLADDGASAVLDSAGFDSEAVFVSAGFVSPLDDDEDAESPLASFLYESLR
jgi:hypothetical protein